MVVAIFVPSFLFFHLIPDAKTASRAVFRPRASTSTTNRKGEIRQGSVDSPRICDCRQTSSRSLTPIAKGATGLGMTPAEIFLWGGGCHGSEDSPLQGRIKTDTTGRASTWDNSTLAMERPRNFRRYFVSAVLAIGALIVLLREHRPSFLRPDLHLCAYVTTADGALTVVDLVKLKAVTHIPVGPGLSGMREHPTRPEILGLSSLGGYVWILDARAYQVSARIPVGPLPYALDFSPDGSRVYTTTSGNDTVLAIDIHSRAIVARAHTGRGPVLSHVSPDGKTVLVLNHAEGSLGIYDAATLTLRNTVSVVPQPDDVAVLSDDSVAFVMSRSEQRLSVVDLQRSVLVANLELAGKPTDMLLKPDGGELYVISPEAHGLQAINTWTHEVGDTMVLGSAPTRGVLSADASVLYVSDTEADRVTPVDVINRRIIRGALSEKNPEKGFPIPAGDAPGALRFDRSPNETLLLVVSQGSGDLAVIRVRTNFLVTMIPVGDRPQDLAVKLYGEKEGTK